MVLFSLFVVCLAVPQLRLWAVPLAFAVHFTNPALFWSALVLTVTALLLWRYFR